MASIIFRVDNQAPRHGDTRMMAVPGQFPPIVETHVWVRPARGSGVKEFFFVSPDNEKCVFACMSCEFVLKFPAPPLKDGQRAAIKWEDIPLGHWCHGAIAWGG